MERQFPIPLETCVAVNPYESVLLPHVKNGRLDMVTRKAAEVNSSERMKEMAIESAAQEKKQIRDLKAKIAASGVLKLQEKGILPPMVDLTPCLMMNAKRDPFIALPDISQTGMKGNSETKATLSNSLPHRENMYLKQKRPHQLPPIPQNSLVEMKTDDVPDVLQEQSKHPGWRIVNRPVHLTQKFDHLLFMHGAIVEDIVNYHHFQRRIPEALLSQNKIIELASGVPRRITLVDAISCAVNAKELEVALTVPGLRYLCPLDGREQACIKIQTTVRRWIMERRHIMARRRVHATFLIKKHLSIKLQKDRERKLKEENIFVNMRKECWKSSWAFKLSYLKFFSNPRTIIMFSSWYSTNKRDTSSRVPDLTFGKLFPLLDDPVSILLITPFMTIPQKERLNHLLECTFPKANPLRTKRLQILYLPATSNSAITKGSVVSAFLESQESRKLFQKYCNTRKSSFLVLDSIGFDEIRLSAELNLPILGVSFEKEMEKPYTKALAKEYFTQANIGVPVSSDERCNQKHLDSLIESLLELMKKYPDVKQWNLYAQLNPERDIGYHGIPDAVVTSSCLRKVQRALREEENKQAIVQAGFRTAHEIRTALRAKKYLRRELKAKSNHFGYRKSFSDDMIFPGRYPDFDTFFRAWYHGKGFIQAMPTLGDFNDTRMLEIGIFVDFHGRPSTVVTAEGLLDENYLRYGSVFPQQFVPTEEITEIVEKMSNLCKTRSIVGLVSFELYASKREGKTTIWGIDFRNCFSETMLRATSLLMISRCDIDTPLFWTLNKESVGKSITISNLKTSKFADVKLLTENLRKNNLQNLKKNENRVILYLDGLYHDQFATTTVTAISTTMLTKPGAYNSVNRLGTYYPSYDSKSRCNFTMAIFEKTIGDMFASALAQLIILVKATAVRDFVFRNNFKRIAAHLLKEMYNVDSIHAARMAGLKAPTSPMYRFSNFFPDSPELTITYSPSSETRDVYPMAPNGFDGESTFISYLNGEVCSNKDLEDYVAKHMKNAPQISKMSCRLDKLIDMPEPEELVIKKDRFKKQLTFFSMDTLTILNEPMSSEEETRRDPDFIRPPSPVPERPKFQFFDPDSPKCAPHLVNALSKNAKYEIEVNGDEEFLEEQVELRHEVEDEHKRLKMLYSGIDRNPILSMNVTTRENTVTRVTTSILREKLILLKNKATVVGEMWDTQLGAARVAIARREQEQQIAQEERAGRMRKLRDLELS